MQKRYGKAFGGAISFYIEISSLSALSSLFPPEIAVCDVFAVFPKIIEAQSVKNFKGGMFP
ncbi:MAG: hypothetical protein COS92_04025 [Desulfobacterales bacterium CG07_land_8_20_14_0_80_52_14]|nr:MAG: hypothetical protein COX20_01780 [Desulfobacterales bacterium CG23_combo_of_CG06-09_8_20_14_all_52_9]PIU49952.1 MAG: hypothetical protein COS92_04025 [Desulfobacterales bacterium CG07_land_8_20_14_0_80_52_14]